MTESSRESRADALLSTAQHATEQRLKIFLGAAPGVGKTFAMLSAARELKRQGVDVVVGLVETHGRSETAALIEGLEVLPRRAVIYRERDFTEFDLDAALARKPAVLLVDELAHTNLPGGRHARRWQDIAELLDAGIEVYTALNVQHLESRNDQVRRITGITVRETVPDAVPGPRPRHRAGRSAAARTDRAAQAGQGVRCRNGSGGAERVFLADQPGRTARTGAGDHRRPRRQRPARAHAGARQRHAGAPPRDGGDRWPRPE